MSYSGLPSKIGYGSKFSLKLSGGSGDIKVALHDLGFSSTSRRFRPLALAHSDAAHGINYNNRVRNANTVLEFN
jgi:hypothetical protein